MKRLTIILLAMLCSFSLFGEVPVRSEELLYSIAAFSGKDYALTFAKEDATTIYLYANADNFLSMKKNFIYYWPITGLWMIDDSVLDVTFDGVMQVIDSKGNVQQFEEVEYTFFNMRGTYDNNWHVKTGQEAIDEWNSYVQSYLDYQEATAAYNREYSAYQEQTTALFYEILAVREQGGDTETLLQQLSTLIPPVEPAMPNIYTVPPARIQYGYRINLGAGEYRLRFIDKDGRVMQDSEKTIVSVESRRSDSIGYEIFPADRWTLPSESFAPSSVLYVDGTSDMYVRPFYQDEFLDLQYNKMIDNQSSGNPNLYRWVRIQQVPNSSVEITTSNGVQVIDEQPFMVEQSKSTTLGYSIVPYDAQGVHAGKDPSIVALHIPLSTDDKEISLSLAGVEDSIKGSSKRIIRVITGIKGELITVLLIFIPLIVTFIVRTVRKRRLASVLVEVS